MISELTLTGLGRGGQQITKAREIYAKATETLVELASLQVSLHWHKSPCITWTLTPPFLLSWFHLPNKKHKDRLCDLRRGDQNDESSGECIRACGDTEIRKYGQVGLSFFFIRARKYQPDVYFPSNIFLHRYINSELDEGDREDFFRLKKVQAKKKERTAIAEAEKLERIQAGEGGEFDELPAGATDLLNERDEDVIF